MANPRGRPPKNKAAIAGDLSLLTPEDKARLREEAATTLLAERKLAAEEAYLEQITNEERRQVGLDESQHSITLDLPEFADRLRIDGTYYFHGHTYIVGMGLFNVMREMQGKMWGHQDEIDGKRSDPRRPLGRVMNRHGVAIPRGH